MDMLRVFLLPTVFLFTPCVARNCRSGDTVCVQTFGELSYCEIEDGSSVGFCAGNRGDTTMECSCGDCPIGDPTCISVLGENARCVEAGIGGSESRCVDGNGAIREDVACNCSPLTSCPTADKFCVERHGFYSSCDFTQADFRNPTGVCRSDTSRTSDCLCSSCPKGDAHCAGIFNDGTYFCGDNGFCRNGDTLTDTQCLCNQFSNDYCPSYTGEIGNSVCNNLRAGTKCLISGPMDSKAAEALSNLYRNDGSLYGLCHPYDPSGIFYGCGCGASYVHDGTEKYGVSYVLVPVPPTEDDFCPRGSQGEASCNEHSIGSRCKIGGTKSRWEMLALEEFRTSNEKLTGVCSPTDPFKPFVGCGCDVSYTQTQFDCPEGSAGNDACSAPQFPEKCKIGNFDGLELEARSFLRSGGYCSNNFRNGVVNCNCNSEITRELTGLPGLRNLCPRGSEGNDRCNEWVPGSACKVRNFNDIESRFLGRAPEHFNGVCSSPLTVTSGKIYGACSCDDTGVLPRFRQHEDAI